MGLPTLPVREEVISVSDQEVVLRLSLSRLQSVWDDGVQWLDVEPAMHLMMGDTVFPVEVQVVDGVLKEVLNYSTVKASLPSEDREYLDAMCSYDNPPCSQEAPVWRYASFVMRSVPQVGRKQMAGAQVTTRIVGDSSLQRLVRTTSRGRQTGIQGESLTFTTVSEVSVDVAGGYVSKFIWRATVRQKFADGSSTDDKTNGLIATRSLVARGQ